MRVRSFCIYFLLQFVSYLNITIDYRAVAHREYAIAACTNMVAPVIAWVMVSRISHDKGKAGMVAVALGGAASTLLGIWLTRTWG